jgi:hypothetical protein
LNKFPSNFFDKISFSDANHTQQQQINVPFWYFAKKPKRKLFFAAVFSEKAAQE